jgi:hypothetical protein
MRQFAGASEREKRLQAKAHEPHPESLTQKGSNILRAWQGDASRA